jgi:hypothetical protein
MHNFTPVSALVGGMLIGLAAVWLLASIGRIAGISTILHGSFALPVEPWRVAFIAGLVLAGIAWQAAGAPVQLRDSLPTVWVVLAGLLVGFGTRMGSGCTSGHGVCGLGRLQLRSLAAVITFMAVGMLAAYALRHVLGVPS